MAEVEKKESELYQGLESVIDDHKFEQKLVEICSRIPRSVLEGWKVWSADPLGELATHILNRRKGR